VVENFLKVENSHQNLFKKNFNFHSSQMMNKKPFSFEQKIIKTEE
jgi:hypothetical protein